VEFLKNKFTIVASPKKDANSENFLEN